MKNILFLTLILLIYSMNIYSQELLQLDNGCVYSGEEFKREVYSFDSDNEAEEALKRIMKYTGLPTNFIIKAANVDNAQASIYNGTRLILYNQLFMIRVKQQTNTDWAAISILAHEIGHHLAGHILDLSGNRHTKELEADRFSGFILSNMGASIDQSLIAIKSIASESGSQTHPPRSSRIAAITNGWQSAKNIVEVNPKRPLLDDGTIIKEKQTLVIDNPNIYGVFNKLWVEFNVYENNKKGMMIHASFNVYGMKGIKCLGNANFYYKNGNVLKDFNGINRTIDGQVCSGKDFIPSFDNSLYNDFTIFMPYSELHMEKGYYDLKFKISLFEYSNPSNPNEICISDYYSFNYEE